jgi:hypothetical protein
MSRLRGRYWSAQTDDISFWLLGAVARPSSIHMIRLLAHPFLPPSPVSRLSLFLSLPVCRRSSLLTGEGKGVSEEQIILRESLALQLSFNSLCCWLWRREKLVHKWKVSLIITHKSCNTDPLNFAYYYTYILYTEYKGIWSAFDILFKSPVLWPFMSALYGGEGIRARPSWSL